MDRGPSPISDHHPAIVTFLCPLRFLGACMMPHSHSIQYPWCCSWQHNFVPSTLILFIGYIDEFIKDMVLVGFMRIGASASCISTNDGSDRIYLGGAECSSTNEGSNLVSFGGADSNYVLLRMLSSQHGCGLYRLHYS